VKPSSSAISATNTEQGSEDNSPNPKPDAHSPIARHQNGTK